MSGPARYVAVGLALCATSLAAQRTWIVDPESRPGFDFVNLPPAILASAPSDTIRVRASLTGSVSFNASTNKDISTHGEGAHLFEGTLTVTGLPADQRFILRDFTPAAGLGWLGERVVAGTAVACQGSVHLQNVQCSPTGFLPFVPFTRLQITIQNCRHVSLRDCLTVGPNGVKPHDGPWDPIAVQA